MKKKAKEQETVVKTLQKQGMRAKLSDSENLRPYIGKWVYIKYTCPNVECEATVKILKMNQTGIQVITKRDTTETPVDFFFISMTRKIETIQKLFKGIPGEIIFKNND
jgi:hypothetical protein